MQVDVEAKDEDDACDIAQRLVDRLLLALSLSIPGGRYHAEMRMIRLFGEDQEKTAWSQSATVTILTEADVFHPDDITAAQMLFATTQGDSVAENAYVHLMTAWQLQATAGAKPLQRSILQHFVLCFEAIVNGVMTTIRRSRVDSIRQEERAFASDFASSLVKRADKPEAIRQASTRLREIGLVNMLPSIDTVCDLLHLSTDIRAMAKDLYRFRSTSLSHPGRGEREAFRKWLASGPTVSEFCPADVVARSFLTAYCRNYAAAKTLAQR
jgi:hypothetical protein